MSHHATGVSVAILPPMKWTLSKPDHLESITFDFKHAGTRIKVHTRHMVLINIQSLPVKTADTWETDQSFSGRSMVEGATIKSCEEHSILMYRGASVPGTFRNVLQIGKGGLLIMDSVVVCLFFKTQKSFPWKHNQKNEKIKQKKNISRINRNRHFDGYIQGDSAPFDEPIRSEHSAGHRKSETRPSGVALATFTRGREWGREALTVSMYILAWFFKLKRL